PTTVPRRSSFSPVTSPVSSRARPSTSTAGSSPPAAGAERPTVPGPREIRGFPRPPEPGLVGGGGGGGRPPRLRVGVAAGTPRPACGDDTFAVPRRGAPPSAALDTRLRRVRVPLVSRRAHRAHPPGQPRLQHRASPPV